MAINRAPWNALVDDDGSNLTGSIWNKAAIKTTLLDPIDGLVGAPLPWTPVDASGAGLPFSVSMAQYVRIGSLIALFVQLSYPSTGSGLPAQIGNLPAVATATSGFYVTYGVAQVAHVTGGTSTIQLFNPTTGAARTNAEMSNALIVLAGVYLSV